MFFMCWSSSKTLHVLFSRSLTAEVQKTLLLSAPCVSKRNLRWPWTPTMKNFCLLLVPGAQSHEEGIKVHSLQSTDLQAWLGRSPAAWEKSGCSRCPLSPPRNSVPAWTGCRALWLLLVLPGLFKQNSVIYPLHAYLQDTERQHHTLFNIWHWLLLVLPRLKHHAALLQDTERQRHPLQTSVCYWFLGPSPMKKELKCTACRVLTSRHDLAAVLQREGGLLLVLPGCSRCPL